MITLTVIALSGFYCITLLYKKAAHKKLMKLRPEQNWIEHSVELLRRRWKV